MYLTAIVPYKASTAFACLFIFIGVTSGIPSSDPIGFDESSVLPLGGVINPKADNIEIRGVYNGRKRRYIIERAEEGKCCRKEPICLKVVGSILSGCKCKKCSPQVPSLDGKSCQDACPKGQEKNGQGGCCTIGMIPNQKGEKCECPTGKKEKPGGGGCEDNSDSERKGKCPEGKILDVREGQKSDTTNPKCQIDDQESCKKPKVPATRPEGTENDTSYKVECGQPDDKQKRPKCNPRTHYAHRTVDSAGVAHEECQKTNQYRERKKNKVKSLKGKLKEKWNKDKPEREDQEKKRQGKLKELKDHQAKLEEESKQRDKLKEQDSKKKSRMGKCSTATALMIGVAQNIGQKRDDEHPYDWTSDYFDEDFIGSDDRLKDWPSDLDIDKVACVTDNCVDADAWMDRWQEVVSAQGLEDWPGCSGSKRSLDARCQKRSVDALDGEAEVRNINSHNDSFMDKNPSSHLAHSHLDGGAGLEERQVIIVDLFEIILDVGLFAARLGISLLARTATSIARYAPRLANIAKNTDRLFKVAPKGQGGAKSLDAMKNAFGRIVQNPYFKKCLQDGKP